MEFNQQQLDPAILAEQKAYKASKESFRAAIKTLADSQRDIKPQRKQNSPDGGVLSPAMAASTHRLNRWELRHLHIAYSIFRGKHCPERFWDTQFNTDGSLTFKRTVAGDYKAKQSPRTSLALSSNKPDPILITKLLKLHVQKATVEYPTQETETVRDSPDGHGGC